MKWLKSTTNKQWSVSDGERQYIVPGSENSDYLTIDDSIFTKIEKQPVVKSLLSNGSILKLDQEPAELKNSIPALQGTNANLVAEVADLKKQLEQARTDNNVLSAKLEQAEADNNVLSAKLEQAEADKANAVEEIRQQAVSELQEKENTIVALEKKIKKLEKNQE